MPGDFVEYSWRNHMPSLGPVDLTVAALTGIALSVSVLCGPRDGGRLEGAERVDRTLATAPVEAPGLDGCGSLVTTTPAPRSI